MYVFARVGPRPYDSLIRWTSPLEMSWRAFSFPDELCLLVSSMPWFPCDSPDAEIYRAAGHGCSHADVSIHARRVPTLCGEVCDCSSAHQAAFVESDAR